MTSSRYNTNLENCYSVREPWKLSAEGNKNISRFFDEMIQANVKCKLNVKKKKYMEVRY